MTNQTKKNTPAKDDLSKYEKKMAQKVASVLAKEFSISEVEVLLESVGLYTDLSFRQGITDEDIWKMTLNQRLELLRPRMQEYINKRYLEKREQWLSNKI